MNKTGRIVLLTASHLCNNPRVVKEADALDAAGFDVEVLGWIADENHLAKDRALLSDRRWTFTPCVSLIEGALAERVRRFAWRAERRLAGMIAGATGWYSAAQLGGWRRALLAAARGRDADMFIAHSALTIWVAVRLLREGCRVGVDMEDWFSREHLPPYPSALVAKYEAELLRGAVHATCTSQAMSEALAAAYGCAPPVVVYNAFPWAEREHIDGMRKDRRDHARLSIHWYSQTLGPGRGLEDLFAALPHVVGGVEVHLRGALNATGRQWIARQIPLALRGLVHVHGPVDNLELLSRIAEHDIGFAGEITLHNSRNVTVTNKILQYLLAGLAIVASDTEGQREVAALAPGAVFLYRSGDPISLAARINELLASPETLEASKRAALDAARQRFCWERVMPPLTASVCRAMSPRSEASRMA